MRGRNPLQSAPPHAVEQALRRLGADLRVARLRRRMTLVETAQKIGTGVRAVADAEKGKASTGIVVYLGLLWAFGLLSDVGALADPARDVEGLRLARSREPSRASKGGGLDNDF